MCKIILLIIALIFSSKTYSIDTKAEQAVVIDFDTNEILFDKNASDRVIPASMTKIMTVYVAFDRLINTDFQCQICVFHRKLIKWVALEHFLKLTIWYLLMIY